MVPEQFMNLHELLMLVHEPGGNFLAKYRTNYDNL